MSVLLFNAHQKRVGPHYGCGCYDTVGGKIKVLCERHWYVYRLLQLNYQLDREAAQK